MQDKHQHDFPKHHKHSYWKLITGISLAVIILIIAGIFFFTRNGNHITVFAEKAQLIRQLDITGEVIPVDDVDLSFTLGGKINGLFVKEGDFIKKGNILARLDSSEVEASLRQARADRQLRDAELDALVGGSESTGKYDSVKKEVVSLMEKAFSVSDNQIKINIDSLYEDPQKPRPEVTLAITSYLTRQKLNQQRSDINVLLEEWKLYNSKITSQSVSERDIDKTIDNLNSIRIFIENLANALSGAEINRSVEDTKISEFRTNVNSARTAIDSTIDEMVSIREKLRATYSDIPVKEAQISSSQATVEKYQAQAEDYIIRAPFNGVVVDVPVTVGQIVASNQIVISLISDADLELEAYVPEVQISDLDVGDFAKVTFDAFEENFSVEAHVSYIDPRATERDGVSTYKTILEMKDNTGSVRAGMTANISINTLVVDNVLIIPQATVNKKEGKTVVQIVEGGNIVEREVQLGRQDTSGGIEVLSGLSEGEELIIIKK